jgi:hypothetical protein
MGITGIRTVRGKNGRGCEKIPTVKTNPIRPSNKSQKKERNKNP